MRGRRGRMAGLATSVLVVAGLATPIAVAQETGPTDAVINEFSANTTGLPIEFLEVLGAATTDYSHLTILEVEGDAGSASQGRVVSTHPVGTTSGGGYWVSEFGNTLGNGSMSLLLVSGWTGDPVVDSEPDGVIDVPAPWDELVDSVAIDDGDADALTYGETVLTEELDKFDNHPGGASRIPDGTDTDTASDWVRNDFDLAGIDGFAGTPEAGEACNTPDAPNRIPVPTDTSDEYTCDGDVTPPTIEVSVTPDTVNPNNHKYLEIGVTVTVSDETDEDVTVTLVEATSDEPDDDIGDGKTVHDILVDGTPRDMVATADGGTAVALGDNGVTWTDDSTLQVRAERMGVGDGRVYTFTWQATDDAGNFSTDSATVEIPKSS